MIVEQGLLIGRTDGMDKAVSGFLSRCRCARFFHELSDLTLPDEFSPDIILVLQHWSDEYSSQQIEELLNRFPLGRMICCYGPWCQSDNRTRSFWPLAVRVPLADVQERIELECHVIQGTIPPLERTAGFDEAFAFNQQLLDNQPR